MKKIETICVVGAGNMGHQIALQAAVCGFKVYCTDVSAQTLEKAELFANTWTAQRIQKNKMNQDQVDAIRSRLFFTGDLNTAAQEADLVIEAIVEKLEIKRDLFRQLDQICPAHTILATNSSYLVSSQIADATNRPDKVLNMHFFNPTLVMRLVEVVQGPHVSDETIETVMAVAVQMGKEPTLIQKEIYGFVVNRIFSAITQEACYLLDQGICSIQGIDNAVRNGLGHPVGPFQLMDLTGIDLEYTVHMEKYRTTGQAADKPSPALVERYARQEYGKKTGKGFYDYS